MVTRSLPNGSIVKLDAEDAWLFDSRPWQFDGRYVACQSDGTKDYFHRLVMGEPLGRIVDHINRDPFDCRKANLRIATHSENMHNRGVRSDSSSGHKCVKVRRGKRGLRYEAYICHNGRRIGLGTHSHPICAAMAHQIAAMVLRGARAPVLYPITIITRQIKRDALAKLKRRGLIADIATALSSLQSP